MKKAILLLALVLFGMAETIQAQSAPSLPSKCKVFYPRVLIEAILKESDAMALAKSSDYGQNGESTGKHWIVWSDRDNNATYTKPDGQVKCGALEFNEKVRIADIKAGYALVYTEDAAGMEFPQISRNAKSRGWVPMNKLLLWKNCPTDKHGIYQKALICVNLDAESQGQLGRGYGNPEDKSTSIPLKTDMNFYYVMKTEGSMALLAASHSMEGYSDKMLKFWVNKQTYVPWNQRSCVEPTWDQEAVPYFVSNDVQIKVYPTKDTKGNAPVSFGFKVKEATGKYNKHLYRWDGDQLRYPILDGSTSTLYNISTFARHEGEGRYSAAIDERAAKAKQNVEKVTEAMTYINIGIVIDGTRSMEDFYPPVIEAITTSCNEIFSSQYKIKIGAVIYRDYADGEKNVAEVFPLTSPKNNKFYEWLRGGGEFGIKSSSADKTNSEALYHGINTALDKLGFKKDQSNIMLVVGDCGNDKNDKKYEAEVIAAKLADMRVQIMGFQVRNKNDNQNAFASFNAQVSNLLKKSVERRSAAEVNQDMGFAIKKSDDGCGYLLTNKRNSKLYIGSVSFSPINSTLPLDKLSSLIVNSVQDFAQTVQAGVDIMAQISTMGFANSNISGEVPDISKAFARSRLSEEDYKVLNQVNALVSFVGYAHKEYGGRQLLKPVIFISSEELDYLLEQLDGVNSAAVAGNLTDRSAYIRALTSLANTMTGDKSEVMSMSNKEIMARIQGLNEASTSLKGYTLQQIASPEEVPNNEYMSMLKDFQNKYKDLRNIKGTQYPFTTTMNGNEYYWIPVEDLP